MKNVSRNQFLHCFRPMVDMDVVIEPNRSADLGFTYITVDKLEDMKVSGCGCSMVSGKNSTIVRQNPKRTFSRVVKAVFFETILAKRVCERKGFSQDLSKSKRSRSNKEPLNDHIIQETNTCISSSPSSSSSSSSTSESKISSKSSLTKSAKQSHKNHAEKSKEPERGDSGFNSGLYLLLLSLTITVLWGRFFAIIFTSIWLYFLPPPYRRRESEKRWPEIEYCCSKEYYKKVIMEGLLKRNQLGSRRGH